MKCKDCKYWTKDTSFDYPKNFDLRHCMRVKLFCDCTEWSDYSTRILTKEAEGNLAFVQDGSDYQAELITFADFGCVQFEEKSQ